MNRRHDIDALRALAFALLILYHTGMLYVADWDFHIKSSYAAMSSASMLLQYPMVFINRWRMELIFLISGIAAAFLLRSDTPWQFWRKRTWRLQLPLLFGILVVVPIQPYVQGVTNGLVQPGFGQFLFDYFTGKPWPKDAFNGWDYGFTWNHLWYLAYLWDYTCLLALLVMPMNSRIGMQLRTLFCGLRGLWLMTLPTLPFILYAITLQSRFPPTSDVIHDWYCHPLYFTVFLYGYVIARDEGFWAEALRLRRWTLATALILGVAYTGLNLTIWSDDMVFQQVLHSVYMWTMLLAILGWGHALLNKPFRWLPWANESVYPWYMLHQSLILLLAYWLIPYKLGPVLEPLLVLVGTVGGCYAISEAIKRIPLLRPCFGLKTVPRQLTLRAAPVLHRNDCAARTACANSDAGL
ncbi:MAG: acyltransferase family protein [Lysobacteraceae bacterium]